MKNNKGVTIISLAITLVVLAIIMGVTLNTGTKKISETKENQHAIETGIIYNAICQRYTKATLTGEKLPGEQLNSNSAEIVSFESATGISISAGDEKEYYKLNKSSLLELGIEKEKDEYIVNYKKGQVLNLTRYLEYGEKIYVNT